MNAKFDKFLEVLTASMRAVDEKYFDFEVAGGEEPIKRERPYCGELYHQMRSRNDEIDGGYDVTFEPDKIGHPKIAEICGAVEPDLIVHNGGVMGPEDNLAVIEVKTSNGDLTEGIKKDVKTINCMSTVENGYFGGIIIVYGELTERKKINLIKRISEEKDQAVNRFILLLQNAPAADPEVVNI